MTMLPPSEAGPDPAVALPKPVLQALTRALASLRYGTIELTVHDGRVVQLERREKVRFDSEGTARKW
jgi:hypothetical protein